MPQLRPHPSALPRPAMAAALLALLLHILSVATLGAGTWPAEPAPAGDGWVICHSGGDPVAPTPDDSDKSALCDQCPACFAAAQIATAPPPGPALPLPGLWLARATPPFPATRLADRRLRLAAAPRAPPLPPTTA